MSDPLINILIRVSRPDLYKECLKSVEYCGYENYKVFTSLDIGSGRVEFSTTRWMALTMEFMGISRETPYYYNLFCNVMKAEVNEGWFMFLDDDDTLEPWSLTRIAKHLTSPDELIICQMLRNGKPKPADMYMDKKVISKGRIGMPCFFLHAKHKNIAEFGATEDADYLFIKEVSEKLPVKFVKEVVVNSPARSFGK